VLTKVLDAIERGNIQGDWRSIQPGNDSWTVNAVTGYGSQVDIPAFHHPIFVESKTEHGKGTTYVDVRQYGKVDVRKDAWAPTNTPAYTAELDRAKLQQLWCGPMGLSLQDVSALPMALFASWISQAIRRRFNLDPLEQYQLNILAAIYYYHLFRNGGLDGENEKVAVAGRLVKALRVKADDVLSMLDKLSAAMPEGVGDLKAFCAATEIVTESIRLRELNPGVLIQFLGGTWIGPNKVEVVGVALEHPPTWLAMLRQALQDRGYKNSGITQIVEYKTQAERQQLAQALTRLVTYYDGN